MNISWKIGTAWGIGETVNVYSSYVEIRFLLLKWLLRITQIRGDKHE